MMLGQALPFFSKFHTDDTAPVSVSVPPPFDGRSLYPPSTGMPRPRGCSHPRCKSRLVPFNVDYYDQKPAGGNQDTSKISVGIGTCYNKMGI